VFVGAYLERRAAVVLFFVPLLTLHWASRGFATARVDRVRMSGLQRATHVLALPLDPRDALPRFLVEVRDCFQSETVDLVLLQGDSRVAYRVGGGDRPEYSRSVERPESETLAGALLADGRTAQVTARHPDITVAGLL